MNDGDDLRRHYPATARNRDPILEVLREVLPDEGLVLEVGSGSGEHVMHFAPAFPGVEFQPSDPDPVCLQSIEAWREHTEHPNVRPAVRLDVHEADWGVSGAAAVLCINVVHITPWATTGALMRGAARVLRPGALLYLYGPYKRGGEHTAPSNASFDAYLRDQDPRWGVRDLEQVIAEAEGQGFEHLDTVEMPANNLSVVFHLAG